MNKICLIAFCFFASTANAASQLMCTAWSYSIDTQTAEINSSKNEVVQVTADNSEYKCIGKLYTQNGKPELLNLTVEFSSGVSVSVQNRDSADRAYLKVDVPGNSYKSSHCRCEIQE